MKRSSKIAQDLLTLNLPPCGIAVVLPLVNAAWTAFAFFCLNMVLRYIVDAAWIAMIEPSFICSERHSVLPHCACGWVGGSNLLRHNCVSRNRQICTSNELEVSFCIRLPQAWWFWKVLSVSTNEDLFLQKKTHCGMIWCREITKLFWNFSLQRPVDEAHCCDTSRFFPALVGRHSKATSSEHGCNPTVVQTLFTMDVSQYNVVMYGNLKISCLTRYLWTSCW